MRKFLVIIEKGGSSYGAYSPDLPGCVAVGGTKEEAEEKMYEAITFHLEGLREEGLPIPEGESVGEYIVVPENAQLAGSDGSRGGWRAESQE